MERVALDGTDSGRTSLTDSLGESNVAVNHYRLAPGERFSLGLHAHLDQEELFVVVEGEATFETLNRTADSDAVGSERTVVGTDELIRFSPGEFQTGWNGADCRLEAYAIGAPRDTTEFRVPVPCPDCGHEVVRPELHDDGEVLVCPECEAESSAACPACGEGRLGATVVDGDIVSACRNCGAESAV